MKIIAINKLYGKLKMKCFEMPNASYTNRYRAFQDGIFHCGVGELQNPNPVTSFNQDLTGLLNHRTQTTCRPVAPSSELAPLREPYYWSTFKNPNAQFTTLTLQQTAIEHGKPKRPPYQSCEQQPNVQPISTNTATQYRNDQKAL